MTDLREAAQAVLDRWDSPRWEWSTQGPTADLMADLRAALAEPVQEPVAWIQPDHLQKARVAPFLCRVEPTKRCADFVPFWTAPPPRKPLTQEELDELAMDEDGLPNSHLEFARAIERAHGIGGDK